VAKGSIFQLPSAWRGELMIARFRDAEFHVDSNSRENGRRIVTHEYPKKDIPYSEDMGRRAKEFSIRGYCIVYPNDTDTLFQRDYRRPRDNLIRALEQESRGVLVLPTLGSLVVVCTKYRVSEESKRGGYCTFDMDFVEFGRPPGLAQPDSMVQVQLQADAMNAENKRRLAAQQKAILKPPRRLVPVARALLSTASPCQT
jgi:prophage DNA circulation protein